MMIVAGLTFVALVIVTSVLTQRAVNCLSKRLTDSVKQFRYAGAIDQRGVHTFLTAFLGISAVVLTMVPLKMQSLPFGSDAGAMASILAYCSLGVGLGMAYGAYRETRDSFGDAENKEAVAPPAASAAFWRFRKR